MTNKTISINPALFSVGLSNKSKKNREKKQKTNVSAPLISPNLLKNKLLKRIKEHKQKETENLELNKKNLNQPNKEKNKDKENDSLLAYNDEFNDSIHYLQTLATQKKMNEEKEKYQLNKVKKQHELERKTIKNYQNIYDDNSNSSINVNLELPEELQQPLIEMDTNTVTLKPYKNDSVPYGILKGGLKPTYRTWNKTQRNIIVTNPDASLIIPEGINKQVLERETRLRSLREKIKQKQLSLMQKNDNNTNNNTFERPITNSNTNIDTNSSSLYLKPVLINANATKNTDDNAFLIQNPSEAQMIRKKIIKKTIKKKYTLGKSQIKKSVGILLKDRFTRKKIINAQRDLKRKDINQIKLYLRDHNLIKIGSSAPNDVVRKLYESAMLAGEITNSNKDTLLYNFSRDNKEIV